MSEQQNPIIKNDTDSELARDLKDIQIEKKKLSSWQKIKNFIKKLTLEDYPNRELPLSQSELEEIYRREKALKERNERERRDSQRASHLRSQAIREIEAESVYVKGGPEAIERKMAEIEARARDRVETETTSKPGQMTVERVPHRYENQGDQASEDTSSENKAS